MPPVSSTINGDGRDPTPTAAGYKPRRAGQPGPGRAKPTGQGPIGRVRYVGSLLLVVGLGVLVAHLLTGLVDPTDASHRSTNLASAPTEPAALTDTAIVEPGAMTGAPASELEPAAVEPNAAPTDEEQRGRWALDQIAFPWEEALPGWRISFHSERSSFYGITLVDERRIEIYVRDEQDSQLLVHIVAHEIGHAVDVTMNDGADRRRWQEARGIESEPWWPGEAASDFATGAGDFAEGFAAWQAGPEHFRSRIAPPPTDEQFALLAELASDR